MNNLRFPLPYQKCTINFELCPRSYHKFMKQRALEANCIVEKGESSILNPNALNWFSRIKERAFCNTNSFSTKATEHHKTINYLGYFQSFKENVQVTFWFCNQQNLETTSIHEHDKIQLSFWGLFRGCWLAAAVFTFPKSVPWNFSLESRYRVP